MQQTTSAARKAALVFGGSRGIGAATVARLAKDGYVVAFTYMSSADKAQALVDRVSADGGEAFAIRADSADPTEIRDAVAKAVAQVGTLSVVVVNAGLLRVGAIDAVKLEELDQMLDVNVRGVFLSIQATVPHLADGARVITIGSNVAIHTRGFAGSSVYQMTKTAVAGMVKGIALDLAPRGITVNNVQPGPTDTDMNAGAIDALKGISPMKRVGQPSEIAGLVSYLAGDDARYVTGTSVTIDGGWTL
ncbi:SDR family oxidoreductase [Cupriavidus pauculus]|uniref:SDR family oxidoreductase n=1 Tax=Cupriavidus pauculus TaxID=82633 RepID=A0A5P2H1T7_9BURK|nr:SDR family oxidoreductase [Cupriavidus pauculus]QET01778.1 SDR family oxidoreductase [Cupriavidus pauculus]